MPYSNEESCVVGQWIRISDAERVYAIIHNGVVALYNVRFINGGAVHHFLVTGERRGPTGARVHVNKVKEVTSTLRLAEEKALMRRWVRQLINRHLYD